MAAPTILAGFWLWEVADRVAIRAAQYKPVPITKAEPTFTPSRNVSVVCCTLKPEPKFLECLEGWLRNNPLEVIVVTRQPYLTTVRSSVDLSEFDTSKVHVFAAPDELPGFRGQLSHGLRQAKGEIIAKVDGHIEWRDTYLIHMLSCFEDEKIGTAGGNILVTIPKYRQYPDKITPWEVAAAKTAWNGVAKTNTYAIAKFRWIVAGGSMLYRTSVVTSEEFFQAFLNDVWHGPFGGKTRLDSGEDTFVSRWFIRKGYINALQAMPETDVLRVPKKSGYAWVMQIVRWERSTVQSFLRSLWETPQVWQNSHVARKTLERAFKFPLALIHLWAWWASLRQWPLGTLALLAYYIWAMIPEYQVFFDRYAYMRRYWWAVVLADHMALVVSPWVWLTLGVDEWHTGESVRKTK